MIPVIIFFNFTSKTMAELNKEFKTAELNNDLFATETNISTEKPTEKGHLFDNVKPQDKSTVTSEQSKQSQNKPTNTSEQSKKIETKDQKKQSKKTFFTTPILILLLVIIILIIIIVVIIKFKTKNTDLLLQQSQDQLEHLTSELAELEKENQILKHDKSKLSNNIETLKKENKTMMEKINNNNTYEITQQKSKSYAELKSDKFNLSNQYIDNDTKNIKVEKIVEEQPQINMSSELQYKDQLKQHNKEVKNRKKEQLDATYTETEMDNDEVTALLNN